MHLFDRGTYGTNQYTIGILEVNLKIVFFSNGSKHGT